MRSSNHSGLICIYRTQDLQDGFKDEYCIRCWEETDDELRRCYVDRQECFNEHAVTVEEFERMPGRRQKG